MTKYAWLIIGLFLGAGLAVPQLSPAQPEEAKEAASTEDDGEEKRARRSPLPDYYGMIGVTEEQRESLNKIRDDYNAKITPLRDQIRELVKERDAKMEASLSPGQKLRLKELRQAALKRAQERARRNRAEAEKE